ncbi:MAG: hypothetical protein AB7N76_05185 [Planctomycetota bacterium]
METREQALDRLHEEIEAGDSSIIYRDQEIVIENDDRGWTYCWSAVEVRNLETMLDAIDSHLGPPALT